MRGHICRCGVLLDAATVAGGAGCVVEGNLCDWEMCVARLGSWAAR